MEDPTKYLNELGVTVADLTDSTTGAVLDSAHCHLINYETFLFATLDEKNSFVANPTEHCGPLTDPVTLERFVPALTSPHSIFAERTYYFWSDSTKAMFDMMPEMYATPHHKMRPKPDSTATQG